MTEQHVLLSRFWTKVDKKGPNDCWEWTASRRKSGYGYFGVDRKNKVASRWIFQAIHGVLPEGVKVCHKCDNPRCVNPAHLFAGTQKDNIQDAVRKGRMTGGRGAMKLSLEQVLEIRSLKGKQTGPKLARRFGVTHQNIYQIFAGQIWAINRPRPE